MWKLIITIVLDHTKLRFYAMLLFVNLIIYWNTSKNWTYSLASRSLHKSMGKKIIRQPQSDMILIYDGSYKNAKY